MPPAHFKPSEDEIRSALASYDQPSNEKSGRREFDDFLDAILASPLDDDQLITVLSDIFEVALPGQAVWMRALSQILIECGSRRQLISPLARLWLKKRIGQNEGERRSYILQALSQISAPAPFSELRKELAVENDFPAVWFDAAVTVTSVGELAQIYNRFVETRKIKPDLLLARAPSIRIRLGHRAIEFFDLATVLLKDKNECSRIRKRLNKMYAFGFDEQPDGSEPIKIPFRPLPLVPRIQTPKYRNIINQVINVRNSGSDLLAA